MACVILSNNPSMWSGSGGALFTGSGSGRNKSASTVAVHPPGWNTSCNPCGGHGSKFLLWAYHAVGGVLPISWPDDRECQR